MKLLLNAAVLMLVTSSVAAEPSGKKYVYKKIDGRQLAIYVSKPADWKAGDQRPAIVFFHGGGWVGGQPGQFDEHVKYFCSRGLICFQVEYRLLDKSKKDPPTICIQDARSAFRWVRSRNQQFGVDAQRIASAGGSAGGHLAASLGTLSGPDQPEEDTSVSVMPNAMILFNPVFDNGPEGWGTARVKDRYQQFSPAHNISSTTPPAIVFLGDNDKLIPVSTLDRFAKKMKQAGVRCETQIFKGKGHGFFNANREGGTDFRQTLVSADRFLESLGWLTGPHTVK